MKKINSYLEDNKSFCFYPFLALVDNIGSTTVCPKSDTSIKKSVDIEFEFKNNLLYLLRKSGVILLSLNNFTNQKYSDGKKEIVELWGFKANLFRAIL